MLQHKGWIVIKTHPIGVEDLVLGLKDYEKLTTTTTTGPKKSQKEANNQTDNQNSVLCPPPPPKIPSLQEHTLSNNQLITIA